MHKRTMDRRTFMKLGGMASAAILMPGGLFASNTQPVFEKSLSFYNVHTGEAFRNVYWAEGIYIPEALEEISHILRDHHTGIAAPMDTRLLDLLYALRNDLDTTEPFQIFSGFRSSKSNAYLRKNTSAVAPKSLHMLGKALDVNLPGTDLSTLRKVAIRQRSGGVGYYPKSQFVHLDVGSVRFW